MIIHGYPTFNCIDEISLIEFIEKENRDLSADQAINLHLEECQFCKKRYDDLKNELPDRTTENIEMIKGKLPENIKRDLKKAAANFNPANLKKREIDKPAETPADILPGQIYTTKSYLKIDRHEFYAVYPAKILILNLPYEFYDYNLIDIAVCRDLTINPDLQHVISYDDVMIKQYTDKKLNFVVETWLNFTITTASLNRYCGQLSKKALAEIKKIINDENYNTSLLTGNNEIDFAYQQKELEAVSYLEYPVRYLLYKYDLLDDRKKSKRFFTKPQYESLAAGSEPDFSFDTDLQNYYEDNELNNLVNTACEKFDKLPAKQKNKLIVELKNLYKFLEIEDRLDELKKSSIKKIKELLNAIRS